MRILLTWLCVFLILMPATAKAGQIQTGAGYVSGECRKIGDSDRKACFSGERWDLGLNFAVKDSDDEPQAGDGGGPSLDLRWFHGVNSWEIAFAILVVVVLFFGIYWGIAALASHRMSLGFYATFDFQEGKLEAEGDDDLRVEKYRSQSTGIQALFYLFRATDIALNVGVAGTTAQISTSSADAGDASYNLRGVSSKIGVGYVPFMRTGVYGMLQVEGTYYDGTTLSKYVETNADGKLPKATHSASAVLGLAF